MPDLILKVLECERPGGLFHEDGLLAKLKLTFLQGIFDVNVTLHVSVDGGQDKSEIEFGTLTFRDRKFINRLIKFKESVQLRLTFRVDKQIGNTITLTKDTLPHLADGKRGFHRGKKELETSHKAKYYLWYEVVPDGMSPADFHRRALASPISLRRFLGRTGPGAMTSKEHEAIFIFPADKNDTSPIETYRCSEVISLRDTFSLHRTQDGEKSDAVFLRKWIARHCNIWGEESVIPIEQLPGAVTPLPNLLTVPNWRPVKDESSCVLGGFCTGRRFAGEDNPATHMSRDFTFNIIPSPAFSYLLAYTAKTKGVTNPIDEDAEKSILPLSHNEWESGSMPRDWRPRRGEYVTIFGRHIFDLGHLTMTTEIHPPHTIVREVTFGNINRIIVGMGFSGGFPGSVKAESGDELEARWNAEFGGYLEGLDVRHRRCWPTNLKKHPLKIKLFPPVPRPSQTAKLITKTRGVGDHHDQKKQDQRIPQKLWGAGERGREKRP